MKNFSVRKISIGVGAGLLGAAALFTGIVSAANPANTTTTTNQTFSVGVTTNPVADPVWLGTTVKADATATLGKGGFANIVYVTDISGSMENSGFNPFNAAVGNCDGDGTIGSAMDASCFGLIALNNSLGSATNVNVGLVAFGNGAKTADVSPAAGLQTFTTPPNQGNPPPNDMEEVIRSLSTEFGGTSSAGIGQFTSDITAGFAGATNYDAALTNMNAAFASQPPGGENIAFFLSDGTPTTFTTGVGSPLQTAITAGIKFHTFAVGPIAVGACAVGQPLRVIADSTSGGTCTEVSDPSTLSTVLPVALTNIKSLELKVNGITVCSDLGPSEPVSMSVLNCDITSSLVVGMNTIEAVATAEDNTTVTAEKKFGVIDLALAPADATNDLGANDNTHAVTATISGDPGQIGGHVVSFAVSGQNAGAAGVCSVNAGCATDASGNVTFMYTVPLAVGSLGDDAISASATVNGDTEARKVAKHWVDKTPPTASCKETINPSGKNVPKAPGTGQNEDGFYVISGKDALDPTVKMFVQDGGSGFIYPGIFVSGDDIKYTQAPGATPSQKKMTGDVEWQLKGKGDMRVWAVDGSGNKSAVVSCLVPPPPK